MFFSHQLFKSVSGDPASAEAFARNAKLKVTKAKMKYAQSPTSALRKWATCDFDTKATLIASDQWVAGVSIINNGEYTPVTLFQRSLENNHMGKYAVHLSNDLEYPSIFYLDKADINGMLLSITTKAQAVGAGLLFDDHDLRNPYPTPNDDEDDDAVIIDHNNEEKNANEGRNRAEKERLADLKANFKFVIPDFIDTSDDSDDGKPVLAAVPKVLPFEYQDCPPEGLWDNRVDPTITQIGSLDDDCGLVIADLHQTILIWNNGKSYHTVDNFDISWLDPTFRKKLGLFLSDSIATDPIFCQPSSESARMVKEKFEAVTQLAASIYFEENPDKRKELENMGARNNAQNTSRTPPTPDHDYNRLGLAIAQGISSSTNNGTNDSEANLASKQAEQFYKIFLMKGRPNNENPGRWLFNVDVDFAPTVKAMLKNGVKGQSTEIVNSELTEFAEHARNIESIPFFGLEFNLVNKAFLVLLTNMSWVTVQWNQLQTSLSTIPKLSVFCFAPMDQQTATEFANNMTQVQMDELISQTEDNKTKVDTKVFTNFRITNFAMATTVLKIFNGWLMYMSTTRSLSEDSSSLINSEKQPFICYHLMTLIRLMQNYKTIAWAKEMEQQYPHLGYAILMKVQNAVARLAAVAMNPTLRSKAADNTAPIHSELYGVADMINALESISLSISQAANENHPGVFTFVPASYKIHCDSPKRKKDQNSDNTEGGGSPKKQKDEKGKDIAFWCQSIPGRRPNFRITKPPTIVFNGKEGKPCGEFMTEGRSCFRPKCYFLHVNDLKKVDDVTPLLDYIDAENALQWCPGKKPSRPSSVSFSGIQTTTSSSGNTITSGPTSSIRNSRRPTSNNNNNNNNNNPNTQRIPNQNSGALAGNPPPNPTTTNQSSDTTPGSSSSSNSRGANGVVKPLTSTSLFHQKFGWNNSNIQQRRLIAHQKHNQRVRFYENDYSLAGTSPSLRMELRLINDMHKRRRQDALTIPSNNTRLSKVEIVHHLEKLSSDYRNDSSLYQRIVEERKGNLDIWRPNKLPSTVKLSTIFPTKTALLRDTVFGKNNLCKSYTVTPSITQVSVTILKSGFLDKKETFRLARALPNGLYILSCIEKYNRIDFRPLLLWPFDWNNITSVSGDKKFLREACLFYYDMDLASLQRYCGGRFTGDHRRSDQMLRILQHILPEREFWELVPGFVDGIPNSLSKNVDHSEFQKYRAYGNMPNLSSIPDLVDKGILKEEANNLSFIYDSRLVDYIPHIGLIAMGIVNPKYKKPRIYRHGSLQLDSSCNPINSIVDIEMSEPDIEYGKVVKSHCEYLWRIAGTFPNDIIDSYDDDISGAFPQMTFHPDTARANTSIYNKIAITSSSCHFGGNFGPPDWEPYSRARCYLAQFLFDHATYHVPLNKESLDLMTFPEEQNPKDRCIIRPCLDDGIQPVTQNGKFSAEFRMFVDDLLSACIRRKNMMKLLVSSSIEAVYLLLGYPGPIKSPFLPPSMAWDKMEERPISPIRVSLGIIFCARDLTVSIEDRKVERVLEIITNTWNRNRKMFTVLDAAILIGNIISCCYVCAWLKWSLHQLMAAMHTQLKKNARRLRKLHGTQSTSDILEDEKQDSPTDKKIFKIRCFNNSFARQIWRMREVTAITTPIYEEIEYVATQCRDHLSRKKVWKRPISHIVDRMQDAVVRSDASTSWGVGGACAALGFWWQIKWADILPESALLLIKIKTLSINVLENVGLVIGFFATITAFQSPQYALSWQPRALFEGDNTTAEAWHKKFSNDSPSARLLTKITAFGIRHSEVGADFGHLPGHLNYLCDALSRGPPEQQIPKKMRHLTVSELRTCLQVSETSPQICLKRYLPSPELLSAVVSAMLQKELNLDQRLVEKNWGRMSLEHNITFTLLPTSWDWKIHNS